MAIFNYTLTNSNVIIVYNKMTKTFLKGDKVYDNIVDYMSGKKKITKKYLDKIMQSESNNKLKKISKNKNINIDEKKGSIKIKNEEIDINLIEQYIDKLVESDKNSEISTFDKIKELNKNINLNPDKKVKKRILEWLRINMMPITNDGCFLAYKRVSKDFKDMYTNEIDHSVGSIVKMNRDLCDSDSSHTCAPGLHFCSFNYLPNYSSGNGKIIIVKINPKDIVAIPQDYSCSKGRACEYTVLEEYIFNEKIDILSNTFSSDDVKKQIIEKLDSIIENSGLTKKKISDELGISPKTLRNIIKTRKITGDMYTKLSNVLSINTTFLNYI